MSSRPQPAPLPTCPLAPPPPIAPDTNCLFIDFDGTLVALMDRPDEVRADPDLLALLDALSARFAGRLAIVSGRSIDQLDAMIGPLATTITLAGSHGAEIRQDGLLSNPLRPDGLDAAIADIQTFAVDHPDMIVEIKSQGVAMHYRTVPALEDVVRTKGAEIARARGLLVQPGKMMVELRGPGFDKGEAVATLMESAPMTGGLPVVIGDDLTDEPALAMAARLGGFGILVGDRLATAAHHALADVDAVRAWLWTVAGRAEA